MLVAISIPIFTSQLEKSREATDLANLRSAYAEVMTAGLTEDTSNYTQSVIAKQRQDGWQTSFEDVGGIAAASISAKTNGDSWTVTYSPASGSTDATATINLLL